MGLKSYMGSGPQWRKGPGKDVGSRHGRAANPGHDGVPAFGRILHLFLHDAHSCLWPWLVP